MRKSKAAKVREGVELARTLIRICDEFGDEIAAASLESYIERKRPVHMVVRACATAIAREEARRAARRA